MTSNNQPQSLQDNMSINWLQRCVELVQGWYYVIVGVWVAIAPTYVPWPSMSGHLSGLSHFWIYRTVGLATGVVGIVFILDRRRKPVPGFAGLGLGWPLFVGLLDAICVINSILPASYLMDLGMQVTFIICWMYVLKISWRGSRVPDDPGTPSIS